MKKIFIISVIATASLPSYAQLAGSVSVEGDYQPIIIETERYSTFPSWYKFETPPAKVDYALEGVVTDFGNTLLSMGVTGRQTGIPKYGPKGFLDFSLGSYLNSRLHAGYSILRDSVNTLDADLKFHSSTLFKAPGTNGFTPMNRKRFYEGGLGLRYSRLIGREGLLTARVNYNPQYFNYYGTSVATDLLPASVNCIKAPTQTANRVEAAVGFSSSVSPIRGWHAAAEATHLGYRSFYSPWNGSEFEHTKGDRETLLHIDGGYVFPTGDYSGIGVDAKGDFLFYSKGYATGHTDRNYGIISLIPSFRHEKDNLLITAGIDLAMTYNAMGSEPGKHFGAFHAAPDVAIRFGTLRGVGLFLEATGGVNSAGLIRRQNFDPYQMPAVMSTIPVYTPIDLTFGLNAGPFAGFTGGVALRYVVARHVPMGGWYQYYLGAPAYKDFELDRQLLTDPYTSSTNLSGFSVTLDLRYEYGSLFDIAFEGTYTPQSGSDGIFNGFDRPRWVLGAKAGVNPLKRLRVEIGYDYRGVRNCYAFRQGAGEPELTPYRLPDLCDLNAKITWQLLNNLDIYVAGSNLLCKKTELLPGLISEGIYVAGGLFLTF